MGVILAHLTPASIESGKPISRWRRTRGRPGSRPRGSAQGARVRDHEVELSSGRRMDPSSQRAPQEIGWAGGAPCESFRAAGASAQLLLPSESSDSAVDPGLRPWRGLPGPFRRGAAAGRAWAAGVGDMTGDSGPTDPGEVAVGGRSHGGWAGARDAAWPRAAGGRFTPLWPRMAALFALIPCHGATTREWPLPVS
jgi:hypothetical protein